MCRYHVRFFSLSDFQWPYIHPGAVRDGGGYYFAALNTRDLVLRVAATTRANVRHVRATLKSRFAESQVGQPDVAFPRGKLYLRIKAFFFEFLVAEHYCFPNLANFFPSNYLTLQTGIKKSDAVSWLVHFLLL